jgi:hypothetical protein
VLSWSVLHKIENKRRKGLAYKNVFNNLPIKILSKICVKLERFNENENYKMKRPSLRGDIDYFGIKNITFVLSWSVLHKSKIQNERA